MQKLRLVLFLGFASCICIFINPLFAALFQAATICFFEKAQLRKDQWPIPCIIAVGGAGFSFASFVLSISPVSGWQAYAVAVSQQAICNSISIALSLILQTILIRSVVSANSSQYEELQDKVDAKAKRLREVSAKYDEFKTEIMAQVDSNLAELDRVNNKLATTSQSLTKSEKECKYLTEQKLKLETSLRDTEDKLSQTKDSLAQACIERESLLDSQLELSSQLAGTQEQLNSKVSEISAASRKIARLEQKLSSEQSTSAQLQQELESKTQLFDSLTMETNKLRQELSETSGKLDALHKEYATLKDISCKDKETYLSQIDSLTRQCSEIELAYNAKVSELNQAQQELDKTRTYLANADQRIKDYQLQLGKLEQSRRELESLKQKQEQALDLLVGQLEQDQAELDAKESLIHKLQDSLSTSDSQIQQLEQSLAEATWEHIFKLKEYDQLVKENQKLLDHISELTSTINSLQSDLEVYSQVLDETSAQLEAKSNQVTRLEQDLKDLKVSVVHDAHSFSDTALMKISSLESDITERDQRLLALEATSRNLKESNDSTSQDLLAKSQAYDSLLTKYSALESEHSACIRDYESSLAQSASELEQTKAELTQYQQLNQDLTDKLRISEQAYSQHSQSSQRQIESLSTELDKTYSQIDELKNQLGDSSKLVESFTDQVHEQLDPISTLQAQISEYKDENESLIHQRAELEQQLAVSSAKNESLAQQLTDSQDRLQQVSEEFEMKKQELQDVVQSLNTQLEKSSNQIGDPLDYVNILLQPEDVQRLEQKYQASQIQLQYVTRQLEESQNTLDALKDSTYFLQILHRNAELSKLVTYLRLRLNKLVDSSQIAIIRLNESSRLIKELSKDKENLKAKLKECSDPQEIDRLNQEIRVLQKEISASTQQLDSYKSEIQNLEHQIRDLTDRLQAYAQKLQYFEDLQKTLRKDFGLNISGNLLADVRMFNERFSGQSSDTISLAEYNDLKKKLRETNTSLAQAQEKVKLLETQLSQEKVKKDSKQHSAQSDKHTKFRKQANDVQFTSDAAGGNF